MGNNLDKIQINGLVWQPDKNAEPVLSDVNAMLHSGSFYGILGPNGAGKSSFVRQLLRLQMRNSGELAFEQNGIKKDINSITREQLAGMISFLPQSIVSDVDFTVYDVVAMGREPHRKRFTPLNREDRDKIEEAMKFTNCYHLKDRRIQFLSGGERQRVMIARTIAQDTPWIILDEPVSSLDMKHQYDVMLVLERLRTEKEKTIIAILHDINLASAFCSRFILMKEGSVYAAGPAKEVLTRQNLKEVYDMEFDFIKSPEHDRIYITAKYKTDIRRNNSNEIK
ncbi:MAG: ABC transporter ATP-binding protein [Lachnospiraceae bacterium]|nr:ABC transporter ATP-binding protein [Lachnospiraceae bacterium]MBO5146374.1 ABC transporter ATP-binding protein [Lachnospiraceae bacterium]